MASLNVFSRSFLLLLCVSACMGLDWCVVKQGASEQFMEIYLYNACQDADCSIIKPGGDCFLPDNIVNHVSYLLNLNYRQIKGCPSYIGTITSTDPSHAWYVQVHMNGFDAVV